MGNPVAKQAPPLAAMQQLIDDLSRLQRLARAAIDPASDAGFLMARAAAELVDRLAVVERRFNAAVALYGRTDDVARAIAASGRVDADVLRIEQLEAFLEGSAGTVASDPAQPGLAPQGADLIVCVNAMHAVNDIPGMLAHIRDALRPDGLFIAAIPAAGTLHELRDSLLAAEAETGAASPHVVPFMDIRQAGDLLQRAGFALPVTDIETVTVRYRDMSALMADLRAMGETNALVARSRRPATRGLFRSAARHYTENHADTDGRIRATFNTIWMSGWAPHPSQPRPLKPGSATASLAKALDDARRASETE
jgi:SAM-dependent methyltransferase